MCFGQERSENKIPQNIFFSAKRGLTKCRGCPKLPYIARVKSTDPISQNDPNECIAGKKTADFTKYFLH